MTFRLQKILVRAALLVSGLLVCAAPLAAWAAPTVPGPAESARAQSSGDSWTIPVNLSHSGAASQPQIVVAADGLIHVFWTDRFAGLVYTRGDGSQWSPPGPAVLPFANTSGSYVPRLLAHPNGNIYAFWLNKDGALYTSYVQSANFGESRAWSDPQALSQAAVGLDVAVDASGRVYLSYIQPVDTEGSPAGVYARRTETNGLGWSPAVSLYSSPYFRSVTPDLAHIRLSASGEGDAARAFVTFDNPERERVFLSRSVDAGKTWGEPLEVDAPLDASLTGGPSNLVVHAQAQNVLLVWQTARTGVNCAQYFQWSLDGGDTWQPRQRLLETMLGCPQQNLILEGEGGQVFLMSYLNKQAYLLAWNGSQWSSPQMQAPLTTFTDPDTRRPVAFGCQQPALHGANLFVVGCSEGGSGDVWITSRQLGDTAAWFSQSSPWERLVPITAGQSPVHVPVVVADSTSRVHVFWSQGDPALPDGPGRQIYYSRLENGQWSPAQAIFTAGQGIAATPVAAVGPEDRLFLAWSGGQAGQVYFSQSNTGRAVIPDSWSEPVALPAPVPAGSAPDISVDPQGKITVAYAIPLNEQRGVYLVQSSDFGQTWSDPIRVFDAAAAGWGMVGQPSLSQAAGGQMHLLWTRYSTPGGPGSLGLYYTRSQDGGATWSEPETIVEQPVLWSRMIASPTGAVHRVWQEFNGGQTTIWHEQSQDGGQTWTRISPVSIFGDTVGEPALASGPAGDLHLLQVVSRGPVSFATQSYALQLWNYDGQTWTAAQSLDIGEAVTSNLRDLAAGLAADANLAVVFCGQVQDPLTGLASSGIFVTRRTLEIPPAAAAPVAPPAASVPAAVTQPAPAAQPAGAEQPTGAGQPAVTADPAAGGLQNAPAERPAAPTWLSPVVGLLAAGTLVLVVFILGARGSLSARGRWRSG